ncbi:FkbM family methyltransferase [Aquicoccus sp. G2-2]|uniref:FkbM family methyltransferase n=1 Tax=Aquicoccus sp. G2-2 TaxID=3092120 RepID=UPI002AE01593|nr:FkbM family methyltransferase [Aquicoccus sp. G2-2]MEA1114513.1 FkbM family methyltransferase [Aquicoccus sp. G2-2]
MGILITALHKARILHPVLNFRGIKVPVAGDHISRTLWKHIWKGGYEGPEIEALSSLIRPGDRILELGTGMGLVSGVAANLHPDVKIEAYEANPALIPAIHKLHELNGITNINVNNAILLPTDDTTPIRFNLHENFTMSSIKNTIDSSGYVEVERRDFRKVLSEFRPDILACDIEGGEEELFTGVTLQGLRSLIIEFHPKLISRSAVKRIYDLCADAGLYPRIELSSLQVVAFDKIDT